MWVELKTDDGRVYFWNRRDNSRVAEPKSRSSLLEGFKNVKFRYDFLDCDDDDDDDDALLPKATWSDPAWAPVGDHNRVEE